MNPRRSRKQNPRAPSSRLACGKPAGGNQESTSREGASSTPRLVEIEKPIYGGAFLARAEGKAVFVPLVLPGEQARVRIVEEKRGYATAEMEQAMATAPERVPAPCPHFGACGGCQYQHAQYEAQLRFKQAILRETLERGGVRAPEEIAVLAARPWAYRNRIRLAFDAAGRPGYRGRRSHQVIPIGECPIAAPVLVKAALYFAQIARRLAPAFKPAEVSLFSDAEETALLVSVSAPRPQEIQLERAAHALREKIPVLRGIQLPAEDRRGGTPRGFAQWGQASLAYRAARFDYRVDQGAFFQVNRWLIDALVERVAAGRNGALAWDLFAGVGLFARRLTAGFDRVIAVESSPAAADALKYNLAGTRAAPVLSSTLEFLRRHAGAGRPDLIVVDPPRTGLGAETISLLAEIAAPALTYVSCDPATLARDLRALLAAGYGIGGVTLADLFPQTFHIETIADLRRL